MKNPKLETISFDTIAKAVKNCTTPSSVQSFLTWNDFEIDEDNEAYVSCEIKKDKPLILTKEMEVK